MRQSPSKGGEPRVPSTRLAAAVYLVFERTSLGALVRATVMDRDMVRALGVDVRKVLYGVFALGAALAAVLGVVGVVGGVVGAPVLGPGPGVDETVLVEQNPGLAFSGARDVAVMQKGRIVHEAPWAEFRSSPGDRRSLLGVD
ncbi:hypothetical protein ACIOG8_27765 [Streptomyces erythrochromogenes]|uniref:ABC transporter permease subunit n=1 Tax=Streptomyces erythrochromogenes TaxID=285574 RepID=UPI00380E4948